jgi:hypothetical protein
MREIQILQISFTLISNMAGHRNLEFMSQYSTGQGPKIWSSVNQYGEAMSPTLCEFATFFLLLSGQF